MDRALLELHLKRLERHYKANLNGYDHISLLDLANSLRIFTESSSMIDKLKKPKLLNAKFDAGLKSIMREAEFAYCNLPPNGVTVKANLQSNQLFGYQSPGDSPFSTGGTVKIETDHRLTISEFFLICRPLSPIENQNLYRYTKTTNCVSLCLSDWLGAIAVRFQFLNQSPEYISRAELIKRVANEYDASHSSQPDKPDEAINRFSKPVERLMRYSCAELPLPFFVLMHIAKSLLESLDEKSNSATQ